MRRDLKLRYFFIFSLAVHLGIAGGAGLYLVEHLNRINPGSDNREQVIVLEIGWSEPKSIQPTQATVIEEKEAEEIDREKIKVEKKEEKTPAKTQEKVQDEKPVLQEAEERRPDFNQGAGLKEGRSGQDKVTLAGGNNAYLEKVRRQIEKAKFYPPQAKMAKFEGEITAEFQIDKHGEIQNIVLTRLSKHKVLNTAAFKILTKASPFPTPTDDSIIDKTIETTLVFNLTY